MSDCCPDTLGPLLNALLDCLASRLLQCGQQVCKLWLATDTAIPWDECCSCGTGNGMAWVQVTEIMPMLLHPHVGMECGPIFEASVRVGILRCAATQNSDGTSPDGTVLTAQSLAILQDRVILNDAIFQCWAAQYLQPDDWTLNQWQALGPQGGCAGGEVLLKLRIRR